MDAVAKGRATRRVKQPERTAVAELVTRVRGTHNHQLHRYLQRLLGSKEAAEEVAQDTYTKLFRLCRPEEVKCPHALLFNMAAKQAVDYLQAERRRKSRSSDAEINEIPDHRPRPEQQAVLDEVMQHLKRIVADLRPTYRSVFVLRFVQQMSHQEIAERLNISTDAAQQRAAGAMAECRSRFAELGIDPRALD